MSDTPRTLSITRTICASRAKVWRCWVEPDLLKQWYCPKPWYVSVAEIDLRVGGASNITMKGPDGEIMPTTGQYLDIIEGESLTFTDAFVGSWIPGDVAPFMVGYVKLSDGPKGSTVMEWGARHWSDEAVEQHKAMGFEAGWGAAAAQLDTLAQSL